MNFSTNISWVPPDTSYLHFNNCTLAAEYAAVHWQTGQLPLLATSRLLRDGLSTYLDQSNTTALPDWELLRWATETIQGNQTALIETMDNFTFTNCLEQVCTRMNWQDDADIAGSGVCIS